MCSSEFFTTRQVNLKFLLLLYLFVMNPQDIPFFIICLCCIHFVRINKGTASSDWTIPFSVLHDSAVCVEGYCMFLGNKKKSSSHLSRCKQRMWNPQTTISSSVNQKVTAAKSPATASNVIRRFYDGLNSHDLVAVEEIIAENCVYEDLIFPHPCVGHKVPNY